MEICRAWFAAIEIYENLCALWPIMESMALKTGFADVSKLFMMIAGTYQLT